MPPPTRFTAFPTFRAGLFGALAVVGLALAVAGTIKRAPPDFSALPVTAVLRDEAGNRLWAIRLAPAAHQIAVDALRPRASPEGRTYQLWLALPGGASPLGRLPATGRKIIAETPLAVAGLAGRGQLFVTLETTDGSASGRPGAPAGVRVLYPAGG